MLSLHAGLAHTLASSSNMSSQINKKMLIIPSEAYFFAGLVLFLTMVLAPEMVVILSKVLLGVMVSDVVYTLLRLTGSVVACTYWYYHWAGEEDFEFSDRPYIYYRVNVGSSNARMIVGRMRSSSSNSSF